MKRKLRVFFVSPMARSFIKEDEEILRKHFELYILHWKKAPTFILKTILYAILSDLTFSWFADIHSFFPILLSKIFRKKSIIVSGGYDITTIPEMKYGVTLHPIRKYFTILTLIFADKILLISESTRKNLAKFRHFAKVGIVHPGVDCSKFKPCGEKKDLAITVGYVTNLNLKRKGIETFLKAAQYLPNVKFVVIGKISANSVKCLDNISGDNIEFMGYLEEEEMIVYYQKAKIYAQLSAHEGFGLALAEAMSCECVPVVTNRGAIPEVVGDTGFYVPYGDPKASAEAIKKALDSDKGKAARKRLITKYSLKERESKLVREIESAFKSKY